MNCGDCLCNCDEPCCRFCEQEYAPRFTKEEYEKVAKDEKIKNLMIKISENMWQVKLGKKEGSCFVCPFLKEDNSCEIYENRPFGCWVWPFFVVKKGEDYFLAFDDEDCHGIKIRENTQELKDYIEYLKNTLQEDYFIENFRKYPDLIKEHDDTYRLLCSLDLLREKLRVDYLRKIYKY